MKIKIKKIKHDAKVPKFALEGDAAMDLYSNISAVLEPGERLSCPTGIAIKISKGYVGLIWDRSGLSHKSGIKTLGGVIDSNYTGEWLVGVINLDKEAYEIEKGQRIAQVIFQKVEIPEIEEVDDLEKTSRGNRRLGSTGKF